MATTPTASIEPPKGPRESVCVAAPLPTPAIPPWVMRPALSPPPTAARAAAVLLHGQQRRPTASGASTVRTPAAAAGVMHAYSSQIGARLHTTRRRRCRCR